MALTNYGTTHVVCNSGGSTISDLNTPPSNLKSQGKLVYTVTSGVTGSNTNGIFYLDVTNGTVCDLSESGSTFIANAFQTTTVTNTPTTAYIDARNCKLVHSSLVSNQRFLAPIKGDYNTLIQYKNKFSLWNNVCPSLNLVGTKLITDGIPIPVDVHLDKHVDAVVENVDLKFNTTSQNVLFGLISQFKNGKPSVLKGLSFTFPKVNNMSFYTVNNNTNYVNEPNPYFDVRPDYQINTNPTGLTTAIRRSYRRGPFTTHANNYYGSHSVTPLFVWVSPYSVQDSTGALTNTKTYINSIEYISTGTTNTDTTIDLIVHRFIPTVTDVEGTPLSDVKIVGRRTDSSLINSQKFTYNSPLEFVGITNNEGKFAIEEPESPSYTTPLSQDDYIKASFVHMNRTTTTINHRMWEKDCKYIRAHTTANSTGTAPGWTYNDKLKVNYFKPGYILENMYVSTLEPLTTNVILRVDSSYSPTANSSGIRTQIGSSLSEPTIDVTLPTDRTVTLDDLYKSLIDTLYITLVMEQGYSVPFKQDTGKLEYPKLNITNPDKLVAGEFVTELVTDTFKIQPPATLDPQDIANAVVETYFKHPQSISMTMFNEKLNSL